MRFLDAIRRQHTGTALGVRPCVAGNVEATMADPFEAVVGSETEWPASATRMPQVPRTTIVNEVASSSPLPPVPTFSSASPVEMPRQTILQPVEQPSELVTERIVDRSETIREVVQPSLPEHAPVGPIGLPGIEMLVQSEPHRMPPISPPIMASEAELAEVRGVTSEVHHHVQPEKPQEDARPSPLPLPAVREVEPLAPPRDVGTEVRIGRVSVVVRTTGEGAHSAAPKKRRAAKNREPIRLRELDLFGRGRS